MSTIIQKQIIFSHISDIIKSLTCDPNRFSRMVDNRGKSLGSFDRRMAGIKNLCTETWFMEHEPGFSAEILKFVAYIEELHEKLLQANLWKNERQALLEMSSLLDEHPEGYDGPCLCKLCCSYGD